MKFSTEFKNELQAEGPETQVTTVASRWRHGSHERGLSLPERLAEAARCLEILDQKRASSGDPTLGRIIEERIVSRELLDLELQDFDEEVERLSCMARDFLTREMTATAAESQRARSNCFNGGRAGGLSPFLSAFRSEACSCQPCRSA